MPFIVEQHGHVALATLSRPEARNAWGQDFYDGIAECFPRWADDDSVRAVVVTGDEDGRAFSAGANLKDPNTHAMPPVAEFVKNLSKRERFPFDVFMDFPKPIVAAVNGYAIGIGCILTFCCDLVVAGNRAEWRLPQTALGILPAYGGSVRLARLVGKGLAMRLAMGFPLDGEEAHRIGLAQWLVPHEELMGKAMEVAEHVAALPPLAVRLTKESLNRGMDIPNLKDAALVDLYRFMTLELTEDKEEAHSAWRERRTPDIRGI